MNRTIIWPEQIRAKLRSFRSPHFTIHESLDKISQVILEAEELLTTPSLTQTYIEEFGRYKGYSRVVIRKFKIYYKHLDHRIIIVAVLFPGQG